MHKDARLDEPTVRDIQIQNKKSISLLERQHDDPEVSILATQQNPR